MSTILDEVEQSEDPAAPAPRPRFSWRSQTARLRRAGGLDEDSELVAAGLVDDIDRLAPFGPAILAIRWGTTAVSVAMSIPFFIEANWTVVAWCGVIMALTIIRTVRPLEYNGDTRSLVSVLGEVAVPVLAVVSTGYWSSPFVFSLVTAIIVSGFARGFGFALRVAGASALMVALPDLARSDFQSEDVRASAQWVVVMLMVALVAGYARRISGEADRQHSVALDRLGRLADANAPLFSLPRGTPTLPAS
ncbi:MAG TPA: hypothetical protein PKA98_14825, partial [Acidimicrobiales bacterium]|nr:hypothetical protein [Acidimicrobiales bacterium]